MLVPGYSEGSDNLAARRTWIANHLRERLYAATHVGTLSPGDRVPGARELARELKADPRVVMAAYRELEREGLVEIRPRAGIFVGAVHAADGGARDASADWIVDLLMDGWIRGIRAPAVLELTRQALESVRLRAACIECNHDQIAALTRELKEDYGIEATGVDTLTLRDGPDVPRVVRDADLLVTTPFHLIDVEPIATALDKPSIVAELRVDPFVEIARLLIMGPVYCIVEDPRFADKLRRIYQGAPGDANLRTVVACRDDIYGIPDQAPTYVTRLARQQLGPGRLPPHWLSEPKAFSSETSRRLFAFVVAANLRANNGEG